MTPLNEILTALLKIPFRPKSLVVNGQKTPYMRLETSIEIDNIFAFLEAQNLYPKDGIVAGMGTALPSALIAKNLLHLFAGTGIVSGSIASREWDELEYKIEQYIDALGVNPL
ncbi:MAG: hypothetical protein AAGE99_04780 [Chlamydiota bacterium]